MNASTHGYAVLLRRWTAFLLPLSIAASFAIAAACGGGGDGASPTATLAPGETPATTGEGLPPSGAALSTVDIVRKLRPSVVQVLTQDATQNVFGEVVPSRGIGTGVILDEEGHIATNNHVVRAGGNPSGPISSRITVSLSDGRTAAATVAGTDPATDLAVIQIDLPNLEPAELGDVSSLPVGSEVVAMGFALGLEGDPTITRGVVSAKGRTITEDPFSIEAIQTDASINPGNSGGPLVDDHGRVVGINTAIIPNAQNIGFSIPIDLVEPIALELIESGEVRRGFLGVGFADVTPSTAANFDLPVNSGVIVTEIVPDSPAANAGLEGDDIIVQLEDEVIDNSGDLLEALRIHKAGESVQVSYYRDGEKLDADLTLTDRPSES